jgi:nitrite reductase (NO-forming)
MRFGSHADCVCGMDPHPRLAARPRIWLAALLLATAAALPGPVPAGAATVDVQLTARHKTVKVAPGVKMKAWTFNGTVPGPVIRATEGDTIVLTLHNADPHMGHSVDFHAAEVSPQVNFADVAPGETKTFSFVARRPGVFMYHCGTSPVLQHIGMGMYGPIIIDPVAGRPPANETVLVQSEFYGKVRKGRLNPSYHTMQTREPTFAAFNGRAFRYRDKPIDVAVGQPQRVYLVDAGPTLDSDFHVVGDIFDAVQPDGNPANALSGVSTHEVPAGGAAIFELTFDQPGSYPFVTHSFRWADAGAIGLFRAG